MTWTPPITWTVGQIVTATDLNEQLRDNLAFLKAPPTASYFANEDSDYQTTATSFVDVDGSRLALQLVTAGGDLLVGFFGSLRRVSGTTPVAYLDVELDGARIGGDDGLALAETNGAAHFVVSFVALARGVAAGLHTFRLQWKVSSGATYKLHAGAGTASYDLHPQFWVREV
jgi:hypothetical protein